MKRIIGAILALTLAGSGAGNAAEGDSPSARAAQLTEACRISANGFQTDATTEAAWFQALTDYTAATLKCDGTLPPDYDTTVTVTDVNTFAAVNTGWVAIGQQWRRQQLGKLQRSP
jgi:hypothetical protein